MTRRGHREGSIGRERGRYRVRIQSPDGQRASLGTYPTREEAEAVLAEAIRAMAEADALTSAVTIGGNAPRVLNDRELHGGVRGIRQERSPARRHVAVGWLGEAPLVSLTPVDVRRWTRELMARPAVQTRRQGDGVIFVPTGQPIARTTAREALRMLRAIYQHVLERDFVASNPAIGDQPAEAGDVARALDIPHARRDRRVMGCEDIPWDRRIMYAVAIFSGLRMGELWGLRWGDVVLHGRPELVVRHSYRGPTKSGRVGRTPLLEPAREALEAWRAHRGEVLPAELVFPADHGGCWAKGFDAGWNDTPFAVEVDGERVVHSKPGHKSKAGISRDARFHDLRHTCASHLLMDTWGHAWSLEEVRGICGTLRSS